MTKIIAEIGSNWLTKEDCYTSITKAKDCGVDAVKFQHYDDIDLYGFDADKDTHKNAIPEAWVADLSRFARELGVEFGCTFFSDKKLKNHIEALDFIKVASSDMQHDDIIQVAKESGKPVYISTGGHTNKEIEQMVDQHDDKCITWLFCDSAYPSYSIPYASIAQLERLAGRAVGISDHTKGQVTLVAAHQFWDFPVIEKHVNLTGVMSRPDSGSFAINESDLRKLVKAAKNRRQNEILDSTFERSMRELHNRRIVATKEIAKGEELTEENTAFARAVYPNRNYMTMIDAGTMASKDYKPGESI